MQFRTKLIGFATLIAVGAALSAMLALSLARGIDRGMQSVTIAEQQLAIYLNLETSTSDLLKLAVATLLNTDDDAERRFEATRQAVRDDVAAVRRLVALEVPLRGEDELEELERLDEIADALDRLKRRYEAITPVSGGDRVNALAAPLNDIASILDDDLAPLIDLAVADEAGEVIEARGDMTALTRRTVWLGTISALLTLAAAALGTWLLVRSVVRPFAALSTGAAQLAQGNLAHRIEVGSLDELGRLSRAFNVMAEGLEASDRALRDEEERLQRRVAQRTAALEQANARLAEQDATRRRFLADVSHELRTPLTVMRGEAEVALRSRDAPLDESTRIALGGIVDQAEHMGRLVDDLLFVARREAGEARLALRPVPIEPILEKATADARTIANGSAIEVELATDIRGVMVEADANRLRQLLMVLLDNALRYSPRGGRVRVGTLRTPDGVSIAVADEGIGIPADELPRIFERFVRGSNAIPGGTGLGLPVAKAIAEAHGGTLAIESQEGIGTTVTLALPAASAGVGRRRAA